MPHMQHDSAEAYESARLIEEALADTTPTATHYRDTTPPRPTGAPPMPQPGRPAMSQRATDASALMLTGGAGTLLAGGGVSLTLWALSNVSPTVLAIAGLAPTVLVVSAGVLVKVAGRAAREVAEATPTETHHHYEGPTTVQQTEVRSEARWFGRSVNQVEN